jgi:hypothetical protein
MQSFVAPLMWLSCFLGTTSSWHLSTLPLLNLRQHLLLLWPSPVLPLPLLLVVVVPPSSGYNVLQAARTHHLFPPRCLVGQVAAFSLPDCPCSVVLSGESMMGSICSTPLGSPCLVGPLLDCISLLLVGNECLFSIRCTLHMGCLGRQILS